ncbi:hypothetical protein [Acinetobacter lactucae]|uniref:hypothetical protein n=1 Tax=Acinetobacter lactucae TaxID=1785128 RepID=UPI00070953E6|nr:hypothetical protein [Acinetobacter lactucae]
MPEKQSIFKDSIYEILKFIVYLLITISVFAFSIKNNEKELIKSFETIANFFSVNSFLIFSSIILGLAGIFATVKIIIEDEVAGLDKPIEYSIKWLISIWGNFYYAFVVGLLSYFVYYLFFLNLYEPKFVGTPNYISLLENCWKIFIVGGAECIFIKVFLKRKTIHHKIYYIYLK